MADVLCAGKVVPWATTKRDIQLNVANTRLWLNIICSRVSHYIHMTIVIDARALMVACIVTFCILLVLVPII